MAINTKQKRFAMLNFGRDTDLLPPADATIDLIDRLLLLGLYVFATLPVLMFRTLAADTYIDGAITGQTLLCGAVTGDTLIDGAVAAETEPN